VPRSHRYESKIDKPELSANLQPLRLAYDCLQILSDLGFLTLGYGFTFELPRDLDRTVRDLVDQMLVGAVNKIANDTDHVTLLLGDGTGAFPTSTTFGSGSYPGEVVVSDLNGDGRPTSSSPAS